LQIRSNGHIITFGCKLDVNIGLLRQETRPRYSYDAGRIRYGNIETDATHFYTDLCDDNQLYAAFTEGTRLSCDARILHEAEAHRMFQEDRTNSSITPSWRERWEGTFQP
jgi:hypothetical protein